jgi:hypothetical protein
MEGTGALSIAVMLLTSLALLLAWVVVSRLMKEVGMKGTPIRKKSE